MSVLLKLWYQDPSVPSDLKCTTLDTEFHFASVCRSKTAGILRQSASCAVLLPLHWTASIAERLTTNILSRQQRKNEHSVTAPIRSKSIQWCLAAYSCTVSCYRSLQPAWQNFRTLVCYSHLITSTVTPDNYKFLGLENTEVDPHTFFPHTNSYWPCSLPQLPLLRQLAFTGPFFFYGSTTLVGINLPTVEVSRSHSDTPHSIGLLWKSERPVGETSTWQYTLLTRDIDAPGGIPTRSLSNERLHTHDLGRAVNRIGSLSYLSGQKLWRRIRLAFMGNQ